MREKNYRLIERLDAVFSSVFTHLKCSSRVELWENSGGGEDLETTRYA